MKNSQLAIILVSLLCLLILSGCGDDDDPGSIEQNEGKSVVFKVWVWDDSFLRYWLIGPDFTDDELPVVTVNNQVVSDGLDAYFMEENGYGVFWREDIPVTHSGTIIWKLSYGGREVSGQLEMPTTPENFICNGVASEQTINSNDGPFSFSWSAASSDTNSVSIRAGGEEVFLGPVENGEITITEATVPEGSFSLQATASYFNGNWPTASLDEVLWTDRKGPVEGTLGTGWAYAKADGVGYWFLSN